MKIKSIRTKLLIIAPLIGLVPMVVFGIFSIRSSQVDLEKEIANKLSLLAEAKEGQVFAYLDSVESRTIDFSSDGFIGDSIKEINSGSSQAAEALNKHLIENKKSLDETLVGIVIINLDGKIVAATDREEMGEDESDDDYFIKGKEGIYTIELRAHEHFGLSDSLAVASPLTDRVTKEPLGVIVNYFDFRKLEDILAGKFQLEKGALTQEKGRTETLELYLVNREMRMFAHPIVRHEGKHFAGMINDTLPVQKCLGDQKETAAIYLNYAREEVLGASMCILNKGWTLVAEVNTKEAFAPIARMQFRLGLISALFALFAPFGGFMVINKVIVQPVRKLHEAAEMIAKGNLDYRVNIKTRDEIEQLGGAFNGMAVKLKESYSALEEKARAEFEEKVKLKTLLESIGDGVVVIGRNWDITLWNKAASQVSGWEEDEVLGKPFRNFLKFIRERDRQENVTFIEETMVLGKPRPMEDHTALITKDGREIPVGDSAAPIFDVNGKVVGAIIVFRDVSKEREARALRSDFAYASHQLRTPVSQALWNLEVALEEKRPEALKGATHIAYLSVKSVQKLVNQLIEVSEIDQGTVIPKMEIVKLTEVIDAVVKEVSTEAKARNIALSVSPISLTMAIDADPKLLKRILAEVLENALYYNIAKGETHLEVSPKGKGVLIEIKDAGIGIPQEQQPLVFTKFFRGSNFDTTKVIGAGLGLYISREYVKLLGGKIWFSSKEKEGTAFSIFLPAGPA